MSAAADPGTVARRGNAASRRQATLAQVGMEIRLLGRRGENLVVTFVIPLVLLGFFSLVPAIDRGGVTFLVPGILALSIISTSFVNLGISTAFERSYGVLKRLGGSPLSRSGLLVAKIVTVLLVEVVQVILVVGLATVAFGWTVGPEADALVCLAAFALGTLAFAGLAMLMAGTLRAEATLALANGLFLVLLLLGGVVLPLDHLPGPLAGLASILPAAALSEALRIGLGAAPGDPSRPLAILTGWGLVTSLIAVRTFRWE